MFACERLRVCVGAHTKYHHSAEPAALSHARCLSPSPPQNLDYRTAAFYNAISKIAKVVEESGLMFSN